MANGFVEYLNSMNNANSNTKNSLAESQVTSSYYSKICVERKLGNYIVDSIKSGNKQVFILTGHAGDGKTSLLVQVLKSLGMLQESQKLKVTDEIQNSRNSLFYVKDMSELNENIQNEYLIKALEAPLKNQSSILISNTGPLINTFKRIVKELSPDEVENKLLEQLDINQTEDIILGEYRFKLINIARIDNVCFARQIIEKIIENKVWEPCNECVKVEECPIYKNYICIKNNKDRVITFVDSFYRWLYENDKRMTIRQMISQISFSLTGNLACDEIKSWKALNNSFFIYNFANLFFGYKGLAEFENAEQIKAIDELRRLNLDSVALDVDYKLFVNGDFSLLPVEVRETVNNIWNKYCKRHYSSNIRFGEGSEENNSQFVNDIKIRKAIRRFYLVYSMYENENNLDSIFSQIYSEVFSDYRSSLFKSFSIAVKRRLKKLVFDALFISYVGMPSKNNDTLYLTLRRDDGAFQNVLLLLGELKSSNFEVIQKKVSTVFEDIDEKYKLYLQLDGNETFALELPLLVYFKSITNGAIATNINPALSHGIAKLNVKLLNSYKYKDSMDGNMRLLINTNGEPLVVECSISEEGLYIG